MRRTGIGPRSLALVVLLALGVAVEAAAQGRRPASAAGRRTNGDPRPRSTSPCSCSSPAPAGRPSWSVDREASSPRPIFVTYSVVRGDAKSYVLQIVTRPTADGTPLSVTQVTVDRASGKALKSVIRDKKGVIPTPESGAPAASPGGRPGRAGGGHRAGRALHRRQGAPPERHRVGVRSGAGARRRQGRLPGRSARAGKERHRRRAGSPPLLVDAGSPRGRRGSPVRGGRVRLPESRRGHGPLPRLGALGVGGRRHDRVGGHRGARRGADQPGRSPREVEPRPRARGADRPPVAPPPSPPPRSARRSAWWKSEDSGELLEEIRRRLRDADRDALASLLAETHAEDLAGALRELDLPEQVTVLRQLPREAAGTVLYEMDDGSRSR